MKLAFLMLLAATLIEVYPNPYGIDEAEYVKFQCNSSCILKDSHGWIDAGAGVHVATKNLSYFEERFGFKADIQFSSKMALSNSGEEICVEDADGIDCFHYGKDIKFLDEGVIYYKTESGWDFRYEDWSSFPCLTEIVEGKLILTPSDFTLDDGWIVASYTFHAPFNPSKLFVEARAEKPCRAFETDTVFLSSPSYKNFHYKFAVKNDSVVITTENWQFTKKGFIVLFDNHNVSNLLLQVLENDRRYSTNVPKSCSDWVYRKAEGGKVLTFKGAVTVFVLPDCNPVLEFISSAKQRLYIMAPYIDFRWYKEDGGLLDAIRQAKQNGAKVKVLLDSRYASKDAVETLRKEGVEVELIEGLHGKAVVADEKLLITSANMNMYGLKLNREVGIIIDNPEAADFIAGEFETRTVSPLDILLTLAAFLASVAVFRKMKDKF
uniref:Phospholipase D-like domain-containing protein n=1 Tax=Archaeoglobus fulgidus TaxID=2234 RepID=A0A7C3VMD0_ARCFL